MSEAKSCDKNRLSRQNDQHHEPYQEPHGELGCEQNGELHHDAHGEQCCDLHREQCGDRRGESCGESSRKPRRKVSRKQRRKVRRIVRIVLFLLLFFFLSDIVTYHLYGDSWARNRPIDPECLWSNTPGQRPSFEDESVRETVDDYTRRLSHSPNVKEKVRKKVLFIGCSYTFGVGINDNDTFVWRLNELLPEVECDNGGVPGYGALRCEWRLNHLLELKKYDLVVYPLLANHPQRDIFPANRHFDPDTYLMPYTELTPDFRFVNHRPVELIWWGDTFYGPLNIAKKAYLASLGNRVKEPPAWQVPIIYAHQIEMMALGSAMHGADFVVAKLEDCPAATSAVPAALKMVYPRPPRSAHRLVKEVWNVAFPEPINEKYKVGNNPEHHPIPEVHSYWAEKLAEQMRVFLECEPK